MLVFEDIIVELRDDTAHIGNSRQTKVHGIGEVLLVVVGFKAIHSLAMLTRDNTDPPVAIYSPHYQQALNDNITTRGWTRNNIRRTTRAPAEAGQAEIDRIGRGRVAARTSRSRSRPGSEPVARSDARLNRAHKRTNVSGGGEGQEREAN